MEFPSMEIACRKIDSFQGGEREVVCLSTVVTKASDFVASEERHNVGTSRQKELFVLCGSMEALQSEKSGLWPEFMAAVEEANSDCGVVKEDYWVEVKKDFLFAVDGLIVDPGDFGSAFDDEEEPTSSGEAAAGVNSDATTTANGGSDASRPPLPSSSTTTTTSCTIYGWPCCQRSFQ